jgi:enolase
MVHDSSEAIGIASIDAYQIFDSRGNPTVEASVMLENGTRGIGCVPSGASTGRSEAFELRDGIPNCYRGKSVLRAVQNVRDVIGPKLRGMNVFEQKQIDQTMIGLDGTENKSRLGANAILAVSMACCTAAATARRIPLFHYLGRGEGVVIPLPEIQLIGGGAHAAQSVDVQDFMIIALGAQDYSQVLEMTSNVYHELGSILHEQGKLFGTADEGGYWPVVDRNEDVFRIILCAIERAGYTAGTEIAISLDIAASNLHHNGRYVFASENRSFSTSEFINLIGSWTDNYPIVSIEDPLMEDDWDGWAEITEKLGNRIQLVGDDLFTTNVSRLAVGIERNAANAILIKPNQIGTITETIDVIHVAKQNGWAPIVSARSGETEDTFIAHLAVATNAGQLKVGSFSRSERMAKWNELIRIQRELKVQANFKSPPSIFSRS